MRVAINNKKGEKFKQVEGRIKNCDDSDEDIYMKVIKVNCRILDLTKINQLVQLSTVLRVSGFPYLK